MALRPLRDVRESGRSPGPAHNRLKRATGVELGAWGQVTLIIFQALYAVYSVHHKRDGISLQPWDIWSDKEFEPLAHQLQIEPWQDKDVGYTCIELHRRSWRMTPAQRFPS